MLKGSKKIRQKRASETLIAVGGRDDEQAQVIEYYDPDENVWSELENFKFDRRMFGSIMYEGKLLLMGGEKGGIFVTDIDTYDFATGEFGNMMPMSSPGYDYTLAVVSGYLYLFGGVVLSDRIGNEEPLAERYNSDTKEWEILADMPTARRQAATAVYNGEIFVFGGSFQGHSLSDVDAYNPVANTWRKCAPMNVKRNGVAVSIVGDYIYAFSGHDREEEENYEAIYSNSTERYDPVANSWTFVENSNWTRAFASACAFNDTIIVAGGEGAVEDVYVAVDYVEQYNPVENKFSVIAPLTQPRLFFDLIQVPLELVKKAVALKKKSQR